MGRRYRLSCRSFAWLARRLVLKLLTRKHLVQSSHPKDRIVGHPSLFETPMTPVGASAVPAQGHVFTGDVMKDFAVPEPLSHDAVVSTIEDFVHAARNATRAGFDGVELHGANGYLLHQFISTNANQRDDEWGGSPKRRVTLTIEVTTAVANAIGAARTALCISPANTLTTSSTTTTPSPTPSSWTP